MDSDKKLVIVEGFPVTDDYGTWKDFSVIGTVLDCCNKTWPTSYVFCPICGEVLAGFSFEPPDAPDEMLYELVADENVLVFGYVVKEYLLETFSPVEVDRAMYDAIVGKYNLHDQPIVRVLCWQDVPDA